MEEPERCKHGMKPRYCALCREEFYTESYKVPIKDREDPDRNIWIRRERRIRKFGR